eukprot:1455363-Pyramimonas_sp.AAC.1
MKAGVAEIKALSIVGQGCVCLQKWVGRLDITSTMRKSTRALQNGWCCWPRTSTSRLAEGRSKESGATSA